MKTLSFLVALVAALAGTVVSQPPDLIWYDFNAANATNTAFPGVGNGTPDPSLIFATGGPLCLGDGDCSSAAVAATTQIDTGWPTALGTGDWTIGMHLDLTAGGGFANYFQYCFGDGSAGSFRSFVDGAAGNGNIILRGPLAQVIITGGGSQTTPVHVAWVYDSTVPEIRGYLNGVLNQSVPQSPLSINGTSTFTVMRYNVSTSSMRPGTRMDDFRLYSRAIDIGGAGPGTEMDTWANGCLGGSVVPPTFQVNQPNAGFDLNGAIGGPFASARATVCVGAFTTATLTSALAPGLPHDLAVTSGAAVPDNTSSGGGQLINVNGATSSPGAVWLSTGLQSFPEPAGFTWGGGSMVLAFPAPTTAVLAHAQGYWMDAAHVDGVSLSAPSELASVTGVAQNLTLGDDAFAQVNFGSPFCAPFSAINFYGSAYTSLFVNSNGSVSFGSGDIDFTASVPEFQNGNPRAAGMWTDLSPNAGGTVTAASGPIGIVVSFSNVPEFGTTNASSFDMIFDIAGQTTFSGYAPATGHATPTIIGITPGGGATDPGGVSWDALAGAGVQAGLATDMVYEFAPNSAVPNTTWIQIDFPGSDGSIYLVN